MQKIFPPGPTLLREDSLVTPAGTIDRSMLMQIAAHRARREREAYVAMGTAWTWRELLGDELRRTWSIARVVHECEHGRRVVADMPATEQDIRSVELQLERLRYGLATPSCPKTRDDIARLEALLAQARETHLQIDEAVVDGIHIGRRRPERAIGRARRRGSSEKARTQKQPSSRPTRRRTAGAK